MGAIPAAPRMPNRMGGGVLPEREGSKTAVQWYVSELMKLEIRGEDPYVMGVDENQGGWGRKLVSREPVILHAHD